MFQEITYMLIFGLPLLAYGGILTLILMICTAAFGGLVLKGKIPLNWHKLLAITTIIFALIHGTFGILAYI